MEKITPDILTTKLGFVHVPNLIQDSYEYILENIDEENSFERGTRYYRYKAISLAVCNDKGKGEYYVFIREGETNKRHEDQVISITRNMLYVKDLEDLLRVLSL